MLHQADQAGKPDEASPQTAWPLVRLRHLLDIDLHILQTLLLRGWSIIAGGVMVLFVPYWLAPVEQGYFYTFYSLVAVQIFFELGMNQVVVQLVSHEAAHLRGDADGGLFGNRAAITRLASLLRLLSRWYRVAALLFFLLAGAGGVAFFSLHGVLGGREVAIWLTLVLFTAANLWMSPALAVLEGMGHVGDVARVRLMQSIAGYLVMWGLLSLGAGLLAAPILAATAALGTFYWLRARDRRIRWLRTVEFLPGDPGMGWRRDVLPLQWRIALSWASGYLILQLLVPATFSHQGAVEAGRLGLTLTIFNSLLAIGLSWVNARLPVIAGNLARGERAAARSGFGRVSLRSTVVVLVGSVAVLTVFHFLPGFLRERFSDPVTMAFLALATVLNCANYGMATFIRAHKEEPLVLQSLVCALIMAPAIYLSSQVSASAMAATFAAIIGLVSLPWMVAIFRSYYLRADG